MIITNERSERKFEVSSNEEWKRKKRKIQNLMWGWGLGTKENFKRPQYLKEIYEERRKKLNN